MLPTGVHCGPSGQSPQEHLSAESQQGGTVSFAAAIPLGVVDSPGKSIWKGEPAGGTRLSLTVPRNSKKSWKFCAPPPMKLMAFRLAAAYTTSCTQAMHSQHPAMATCCDESNKLEELSLLCQAAAPLIAIRQLSADTATIVAVSALPHTLMVQGPRSKT